MIELRTKYDEIKIYAKTFEEQAMSQIIQIGNSPLGENAHIRIMPDAHAGAGCVIGTTMRVTDKICPNVIGVDIGCGVTLVKTNGNFKDHLETIDNIIRTYIPYGEEVHSNEQECGVDFSTMKCWDKLDEATRIRAKRSCGTLGGGRR